ncbi:MAG: tetratricopeptide repeat protein [Candidatus Fervidibacter sp.]|uniref:tetratricopeptide repeat protein n=1 Tax=Candidatus Fervidibacter sp. TaxID=3100871 RepID=UPI00404A129C
MFGQQEEQPDIAELLNKAEALRYNGHYEEAEKLYLQVLERDPDNAAAHHSLGLIYYLHGGDFEKSLVEFKRAVELEPENVTYRLDWAKALTTVAPLEEDPERMMELLREAKAEFEKVLEIEPGNQEAVKQLAYLEEWGV